MKTILIGAAAALSVGGMVAAGSMSRGGGGGEVYDRPIAQVQAELAAMPMAPEVTRAYRKVFGDRIEVEQGPESVVWRFTAEGHELARFTATLTEEGAQRTRVSVDFTPAAILKEDDRKLFEHPLINNAAELMMAEQIDSSLEGRSFDESRVKAAVTAYAAMHPDEVDSIEPARRELPRLQGDPEPGGWGADAGSAASLGSPEAANAAADVSGF